MTEPPAKRQARSVQPSLTAVNCQTSDHPTKLTELVTTVVDDVGTRTIISSYLTVPELVRIRGVSETWCQLFSQPCCWKGSSFQPTTLQLEAVDCRLPLNRMQHLEVLTLTLFSRDEVRTRMSTFVEQLMHQLSACSNMALKTLVVEATISAEVMRALPRLQVLHEIGRHRVSAEAYRHLPQTLSRVHVDKNDADGYLMHALLRHPLPLLEHLSTVCATPAQIQQLKLACPHLTSLSIRVASLPQVTGVVAALPAITHLTELTIEGACCTAGLLIELGRLPHLRRLTLHHMQVDLAFWQTLVKLQMENLSNAQSQTIQINMEESRHAQTPRTPEFWSAMLRASGCRNKFQMSFDGISKDVWQTFAAETQPNRSMLQSADRTKFAGGTEDFVTYVTHHSNLTELNTTTDRRRDLITDNQLVQLVSALPKLISLSVNQHPPAIIRQGLVNSGALTKLQRLIIKRSIRSVDGCQLLLPQLLSLIKDAVSLQEAAFHALNEEWTDVELSDIKASTQHVRQLDLEVVVLCQSTPQQEAADVVKKLLHLANLLQLNLVISGNTPFRYPQYLPLSWQEMANVRREAGLNSVWISYELEEDLS